MPQDAEARELAIGQFEHFIRVEGQQLIGWRDVPVDTAGLTVAEAAEPGVTPADPRLVPPHSWTILA